MHPVVVTGGVPSPVSRGWPRWHLRWLRLQPTWQTSLMLSQPNMSDPEQPTVIIDQSGQWVDSQFNADNIQIVTNVSEGLNGKRCPACGASPMRRTQVVWAENTRRHGAAIVLLSNIALRVVPPRRPFEPMRRMPYYSPQWSRTAASFGVPLGLTAPILLSCAAGFVIRLQSDPNESSILGPIGALLYILIGGAGWITILILGIVRVKRARDQDNARRASMLADAENEFAQDVQRYEDRLVYDRQQFERWKRSWFCMSCTKIIVERGSVSVSSSDHTPSMH
jgi:hypothetical protein